MRNLKRLCRKSACKGVITVETTYVMAVILYLLFLSVMGLFYYHDKEILSAGAYEAVTVAALKTREKTSVQEENVKEIFKERTKGKCVLFGNSNIDVEASVQEEYIRVIVRAKRRQWRLRISETAAVTDPEKKIRDKRRLTAS